MLNRLLLAAAAALLLTAPAARAAIPFDLSTVPTQRFTAGSTEGVGELAGNCDLDADGKADLVVGASGTGAGTVRPGAVHVLFGDRKDVGVPQRRLRIDGDLGAPGWDPGTGAALDCGGDVDGDGVDDLVIGAPTYTPQAQLDAGRNRAGAVFVIFGDDDLDTAGTIALASLGGAGFRIDGPHGVTQARIGTDVATVGDLDGDGRDEVAASGPSRTTVANVGASYVVAGRATTTPVALEDPGAALLAVKHAAAGALLSETDAVGDLDGDGRSELAVAAPGHAGPNGTLSGAVFVIKGSARGTVDVSAATLPSDVLFPIWGAVASGRDGAGLAALGDVNGDGLGDLGVGTDAANGVAESVSVVFGAASGDAVDLNALGARGYRIAAPAATTATGFGETVERAGDINGDGRSDLLASATGEGSAYVVYGKATTTGLALADLTVMQGARLGSEGRLDPKGPLVAVGDWNADTFADLAVARSFSNEIAVDVLFLPDPAAPPETEPEEPGGDATPEAVAAWGIRANLRSYVYGRTTLAGYVPGTSTPPITAGRGATCPPNPDTAVGGCDPQRRTGADYPRPFAFTPLGADVDLDAKEAEVHARGAVVFDYPEHCFAMTFADPRWTFTETEADVSVHVTVDVVEDCDAAGAPVAGLGDEAGRVHLGTFPVTGWKVQDTAITWEWGAGTLSQAAADFIKLLSVGAELDAGAVTVPRKIGDLPPEPQAPEPEIVEVETLVPGPPVPVPGPATTVTVPGPPVTVPAPTTPPVPSTSRVDARPVTGTRRGRTVTISRSLGAASRRVWLMRGSRRVATGTLKGRTLTLTRAVRLSGRYTLRPAAGGTTLPTVTLTIRR